MGLAALFVTGLFLVPLYGITGGAVSTSIAFTAMLLFSFITFRRITHADLGDFLPTVTDLRSALKA